MAKKKHVGLGARAFVCKLHIIELRTATEDAQWKLLKMSKRMKYMNCV